MKKNLPLLMLLLIYIMTPIGNGTVYANDVCGFDHNTSQLLTKDYNQNARITGTNSCRPTDVVMTFPVVIHVVNIGSGNLIPTSQIDSAMAKINRDFANVNGFGPDSKMRFVLAKRDTSGNACTGIEYIDGTQLAEYVQYGVKLPGVSGNGCSYSELTQFNWPVDRYINVFIINNYTTGSNGSVGNYNLIIKSSVFSQNISTFAHEMGHYFGLWHVFGQTGVCDPNDDCAHQGDFICDTPPILAGDVGTTSSCVAGDATNSTYNFMSYGSTRNRFTQGQVDRMRNSILNGYELWPVALSDAQIPTTVGNEVVLDALENSSVNLCDGDFIPQITIRNLGVNTVNTITVETYIDDVLFGTSNLSNVALATKSTKTINLNTIAGVSAGSHNIKCVITKVNGNTGDYFVLNNSVCGSLYFSSSDYHVSLNSSYGNVSGSGDYPCNTLVTISTSSTDANNYRFVNWTDDDNNNAVVSTTPNYSFIALQSSAFTANYERIVYTINASSNNSSVGNVSVSSGNKYYNYTTTVSATVINSCYQFVNWTENGNIVSMDSNYTFTITGNRNLVANFAIKTYSITATVLPINSGTVTGTGTTNCGLANTLSAQSNSGFEFLNWTENGSIVSTDSNYTFYASVNRNLVANFKAVVTTSINDHYTQSINVYPNPTSNFITIKGNFIDPQVIMRDVSGKQYQMHYMQSIDISHFPNGLYIIEIIDNNKTYIGKVVKQ